MITTLYMDHVRRASQSFGARCLPEIPWRRQGARSRSDNGVGRCHSLRIVMDEDHGIARSVDARVKSFPGWDPIAPDAPFPQCDAHATERAGWRCSACERCLCVHCAVTRGAWEELTCTIAIGATATTVQARLNVITSNTVALVIHPVGDLALLDLP